jgi:hypothetical protein
MNSTNRAANRLFLLVVGVVLAASGAGAILLGTSGSIASTWSDVSRAARSQVAGVFADTTIPGSTASWAGLGVLVLLAALIVVLVVFVVRQGNGHTAVVLDTDHGSGRAGGPDDRIVIDTHVARTLLADEIERHPELVSVSVSTYRVRKTPVLKIAATCRRGVAPIEAQHIIEDALRALDGLIGREVPALIELTGGFRARVAASTRLR